MQLIGQFGEVVSRHDLGCTWLMYNLLIGVQTYNVLAAKTSTVRAYNRPAGVDLIGEFGEVAGYHDLDC